jgi:hypothetical protein
MICRIELTDGKGWFYYRENVATVAMYLLKKYSSKKDKKMSIREQNLLTYSFSRTS